jgi:hypothetical protein
LVVNLHKSGSTAPPVREPTLPAELYNFVEREVIMIDVFYDEPRHGIYAIGGDRGTSCVDTTTPDGPVRDSSPNSSLFN